MKACLLFVFAINNAQLIPQALKDLYNVDYSLYRGHQLINAVKGLDAIGQNSRNSYPLSSPRPSYGVTAKDVQNYLQHSLISVCKADKLDKCFCEGKFADLKIFINETFDAQAAVATDSRNKLIIISYRGSVSKKNWDTNFRSQLINYPKLNSKIKIHQGFYEHFRSLQSQMEPEVLKLLNNPKYKNFKLHVTGYSLGASLAAVALPAWTSLLSTRRMEKKAQLFIYSGPRPGNVEFSRYLETLGIPLIRYAKNGDVVPHVPDQSVGYSHVGQEFYDGSLFLRKKEVIRCANNVIEDGNCLLQDTQFHFINHFLPFQKVIPLPPFC
ncbi:hypothetical protein DSO57_1036229 [Entomophthora muscae]|uniref:Uncharacterized protein n=1 Tax=Entomophthora muscae TaxID=34485 RepID=A0ACC2TY16_9FUNG|nr:hypothetical protein DSO57_1036229 [Entomophthora muscae]